MNISNSNQISQRDYNNNYHYIELNKRTTSINKKKRIRLKYPFHNKHRVYDGVSISPTNQTLTLPSDVLKSAYRDISFNEW